MPKISTGIQTDQFLGLLQYQDKLTKLYQRIKVSQAQEQEYIAKIEYLQYKNQALEKSLFQYELKSRDKQTYRNQVLLHDLVCLEEEIVKEKGEAKNMGNMGKMGRSSIQAKSKKSAKDQDTPNNSLLTIKQQPDLQNPPTSKRPSSKPQSQTQTQSRKQTRRPMQQIDQNIQKISHLQQQLQKQQKNRRVMDIELKRLRKLNEEYSAKCRKLQKLVDVKSELYGNLSMQLNQNCFNQSNVSGFGGYEENQVGVLFR